MRHKCQVKIQCDCVQCKRKSQHKRHSNSYRHEEDLHLENTDFEYDFFEDESSVDYIFEKDILEMDDNL